MMSKSVCTLAILAIAVASLLHTTAAKTLVVGDSLGWLVPPGGSIAYATWAAMQDFEVGDVLVFNFTTGQQDVAMVTKEAYLTCNSKDPISLKTTGPANFTLDKTGKYYFISTMDKHCQLGQKLEIYVLAPGPGPSPAPHHRPKAPWAPAYPRGPIIYTVGDALGWLVPPGGPIAYETWAYYKTFMVGDTLVFNFVNGTQDVAAVTKESYDSCNTSSPLYVLSTSPAKVILNTTGEHFFTSTYPRHCILGQKLAVNVTAASGPVTSPSSIAQPPSSSSSSSTTTSSTGAPAPVPASSAPPRVAGTFITLLALAALA